MSDADTKGVKPTGDAHTHNGSNAQDVQLASALSKLDAVRDTLTVKRVFGDAYETKGATVIPDARVRGGGGGGTGQGSGPGENGSGSGAGVGFGVDARPMGVFVVKDGSVRWQPAIDPMRMAVLGTVLSIAASMAVRHLIHRS